MTHEVLLFIVASILTESDFGRNYFTESQRKLVLYMWMYHAGGNSNGEGPQRICFSCGFQVNY